MTNLRFTQTTTEATTDTILNSKEIKTVSKNEIEIVDNNDVDVIVCLPNMEVSTFKKETKLNDEAIKKAQDWADELAKMLV